MSILSKEAFLAVDDRKTELVEVPELGKNAQVRIRSWSVGEADKFTVLVQALSGADTTAIVGLRAKLVALSVVNEDGSLMFDSEDDVSALMQKSPVSLNRIHDAAMKLNGFSAPGSDENISPND